MSEIYDYAGTLWATMSADYQQVVEAQYAAAVAVTNGYMVNAKGRAKGYDSWQVFMGNAAVHRAYATTELRDYLTTNPRLTQTAYEAQWLSNHLQGSEV